MNYYTVPVLLQRSKFWNVNDLNRKNLEAVRKWFLGQMLRVPWMVKVANNDCMEKWFARQMLHAP